ncbi:hypothetical protein EDD11_000921 [Mortierella claussenii]|nr:hypothetical protein EDD11_000921 [Mortierella claussenii]
MVHQAATQLRTDSSSPLSIEQQEDSLSTRRRSSSNTAISRHCNSPSTAQTLEQESPLSADRAPVGISRLQQQQQQQQQQLQADGLDLHRVDHRPDSPASLEDSQSESGVDLLAPEIAGKDKLTCRFFEGSTLSAATNIDSVSERGMIIHTDVANTLTPMSPMQVATPPLSPIKIISKEEAEGEGQRKLDNENEFALSLLGQSASQKAEIEQEKVDAQEEHVNAAHQHQSVSDTSFDSAVATMEPPVATEITLQPVKLSPVPKASAWSTLLPGVAPIPPPKPPAPKQTRAPTTRKSDDIRLHERFPIVLPLECEAKLSMDMVDLFEDLLPTEESHNRRTKLIKKIKHILHTEWPEQDIQTHPFGSTVNDLGTSSSDVDICIMTTWSGLKNVQMLANAFRKHGMQKVFCVPRAKVPIVKLWDPELHLSCDMNINTPLGLLNTKMIKTYVAIDPRVRPFAMIIKHWARRRVLNDAANGGTISTYTWICIVINFLQMRSPPILPKLHQIPHMLSEDNQVISGNNTSFCQDLEQLEGFGLPNKETLGGLLYAFFRRFAIEFDYDNHVISVREGCYLTKESKGWHLPGKQYKLFCVEEPFDTSRNLGNSSDMISSKGLKEEFKRALEVLYTKVSLNECCEQFVFPASYYHTISNTRKGGNGNLIHTNNYAPGRRYANGYRTQINYYDDDYDDDEEDNMQNEISVMETLNIGTRPPHSKDPTGSSKHNTGRREPCRGHGTESGSSSKAPSSTKDISSSHNGGERNGEQSGQRSQSRSRPKQSKSEKEGGSDSFRSGVSRSGKQEKTSGNGSASTSGQRNKKSSGGNSSGDRQKNGRGSSNGASGSGGRTPRATVEFNLADIASAAPKLLLLPVKADQDTFSTVANEHGSVVGDESGAGKGKKKVDRRNVVWSTNSNRGESLRRQPTTKLDQPLELERGKMIFMASEDEALGTQASTAHA